MKFGVREICEVVMRAKSSRKIGSKQFFKDEPVLLFDTLKTSSMEGAATTVYAQGGRGNSRLIAWEGERTLTFTMEDALISPEGLAILAAAELLDASATNKTKVHTTATVALKKVTKLTSASEAIAEGTKVTESVIEYTEGGATAQLILCDDKGALLKAVPKKSNIYVLGKKGDSLETEPYVLAVGDSAFTGIAAFEPSKQDIANLIKHDSAFVDFYVETENAKVINITPDVIGGNFYLEASTLFRDQDGVDHPAEFIIPNCKIQSNFNFSMASTGDPSTFTFTIDAFPGYTWFDPTKKVLATIQVLDESGSGEEATRTSTKEGFKTE